MVDGVRFVPWERMAEYADLNPDLRGHVALVRSALTWPALAGAKRCCGCRTAYFAHPGHAFEVVDRVVVSSIFIGTTLFSGMAIEIVAGKIRVVDLGIQRELLRFFFFKAGGHEGLYRRCLAAGPSWGLREFCRHVAAVGERVRSLHCP